jgi:ATP-dependent Clp protease adapter protein ClpS
MVVPQVFSGLVEVAVLEVLEVMGVVEMVLQVVPGVSIPGAEVVLAEPVHNQGKSVHLVNLGVVMVAVVEGASMKVVEVQALTLLVEMVVLQVAVAVQWEHVLVMLMAPKLAMEREVK